ncbi:Protein disulfide-isomerase [Durusdinium trenchii]|uniref:Protein disulfide-isomerase n=1 Tax=Durusdinium trenchii TaxID=1381693 RepID=A0ABP0Q896_9DINO
MTQIGSNALVATKRLLESLGAVAGGSPPQVLPAACVGNIPRAKGASETQPDRFRRSLRGPRFVGKRRSLSTKYSMVPSPWQKNAPLPIFGLSEIDTAWFDLLELFASCYGPKAVPLPTEKGEPRGSRLFLLHLTQKMGWGGCGKDWGAAAGGWGGGDAGWGGDGGWGGGGCSKGGGGGWGGESSKGCGGGSWGGDSGKGFGGGCKGGKGYGAGGGKGAGPGSNWGGAGVWQPMFNPMLAMMMKGMGKQTTGLRNFSNEKKVWIGGLPANQVSKEVNMKMKDHMSTAGFPCLYAEIGKSGSGGAAFKSASEAQSACAALNGSVFEGLEKDLDICSQWAGAAVERIGELLLVVGAAATLAGEVTAVGEEGGAAKVVVEDGVVRAARAVVVEAGGVTAAKALVEDARVARATELVVERGAGPGSSWGGAGVWQPMFNPMLAMMMKGMGKVNTGLRNFANEKKVFIGGMPENNVSKDINMKLKDHMSSTGVTCLYAEIGRSGTGGAAFKSNSEAQTVAAALNGSSFEGYTLQVEMWGIKPPRTS